MKLYVLVSDGGDGSYYPRYILDQAVIDELNRQDEEGTLPDHYSDGDGFHYNTINVPDDSTPESLGISVITLEDISDEDDEYV